MPIRVIRQDHVPRCGPLGGVYTALVTSHASAILFLSCDMPFVTPDLLRNLVSGFHRRRRAFFVVKDGVAGFPFLLPGADLGTVKLLLSIKRFSLQHLAKVLRAQEVRVPDSRAWVLLNVNTLADLKVARQRWRVRAGKKGFKKAAPNLVNRYPFR
jgi:molybdopterin-guanine dinucleotide biosynthesis protein A